MGNIESPASGQRTLTAFQSPPGPPLLKLSSTKIDGTRQKVDGALRDKVQPKIIVFSPLANEYRDRLKGLYMVGRSLFLLLLTCSVWLCLGPAPAWHTVWPISVKSLLACKISVEVKNSELNSEKSLHGWHYGCVVIQTFVQYCSNQFQSFFLNAVLHSALCQLHHFIEGI